MKIQKSMRRATTKNIMDMLCIQFRLWKLGEAEHRIGYVTNSGWTIQARRSRAKGYLSYYRYSHFSVPNSRPIPCHQFGIIRKLERLEQWPSKGIYRHKWSP